MIPAHSIDAALHRIHQQPSFGRSLPDARRETFLRCKRLFGFLISHELDSQQQADPARISDNREIEQAIERAAKPMRQGSILL